MGRFRTFVTSVHTTLATMAGLLRGSLRPLLRLPKRSDGIELIKPIGPNFPKSSERTMGPHGWMKGSYYFWSLTNPIRGPLYRPPWVVGGIHNPTIDPVAHFNTQDRHQTVSAREFVKCFIHNFLPARVMWLCVMAPISMVFFWIWVEQRREPMEIHMDREE